MTEPVTGDASVDEPEGTAPERIDLRETYRQQMLASIGGWSGTVITAIPPVVFVVVNAVGGLRTAVWSAIGTAVLLTIYRLARRQSIQQAVSGLFAVVVAALIAARTGQARGYFLLGIWSSFVYGGVFLASMLVRRPLVGLFWEFVDPTPPPNGKTAETEATATAATAATADTADTADTDEVPWHRRPPLLRAYLLATAGGVLVFLSRGIVQLTLFKHNSTGWLAFARVAMGFPLWLLAVGFGFWVVRRARQELRSPEPA